MATQTITVAAPKQPDIAYAPDADKYRARTARRLRDETLPTKVPGGFPEQLQGDLVWDGDSLPAKYDWTYRLSSEQLNEIDSALRHFNDLDIAQGYIDQHTFPLPTLRAELRRLSNELHNGHGFFVVRGLDADAYTRKDLLTIYAGLSTHIAPGRGRQDSQFEGQPADVVLAHIKDLSATSSNVIGAPAYTADKQVFHTDAGDIVSLFCLNPAAHGGESQLASTWRVYNELAATRPDLIHTLAGTWVMDGYRPFTSSLVPLLVHQAESADSPERVLLQYARRSFVGFGAMPRSEGLPPITEAQAEALDALHFLGEKFHVALDFQKGDIQYVNNLALFHARKGFTDTESQQRHLVRLWLRDPELAWKTPEQWSSKWERLYNDVEPSKQVFPSEPYIRSASSGTTASLAPKAA